MNLSDRLNRLSPSATLAMSQKSAELKAQGIDVINLNGERVATVSDIAELHSLTPGIYVLKVYNESSIVKTIKYAKR